MKLYLGTSGLVLPVPNKAYYPEAYKNSSRLCYYGSLTNSIEVNSSFYKIPQAATLRRWTSEVPEDFRFTIKLFRDITHNKGLAFDPELVIRFMDAINAIGDKKGCLLVQFPPSVRLAQFQQLAYLLRTIREADAELEWHTAVEFRHPSLYNERFFDLLDDLNMGLVIHDKPPANTPMITIERSFVYLRFHGPMGNYRGSYPDDVLSEYASYILEWLDEGKEVYVYFNNTMGESCGNMNKLMKMINNGY